MKLLKYVLASLFVCSTAFAQAQPIRNDTPTALRDLGSNLSVGRNFAVDQYGQQKVLVSGGSSGETQSVIPVSNATDLNGVGSALVGYGLGTVDAVEAASTTTVINATSHVARVGDALYFTSGTAGNIGVWSTVSAVTANTITLSNALPATPAAADSFQILRPQLATKAEDSVAASGDALVGVAGVLNSDLTGNAAENDYSTLSLGNYGQALSSLVYDPAITEAFQPTTREDFPLNANQAVVLAGVTTQDPLTVDQTGNNDVGVFKVDRAGRTITTLAPAGESFYACSAVNTGLTLIPIKAAVASNRIYVTQVSCVNNSAVPSLLTINDNATVMLTGGVGALTVTGGTYVASFPVPLRGSVNTALNFQMATTATATTCCASGYISVN